jgi:FKBP-type peptidyl-prolyl cis-trans isomerase
MKKILLLGIAASTAVAFSSCNAVTSKTPKTEMDSVAYCLGIDVGNTVKNLDKSMSVEMIAAGIKDMLDEKGKVTVEEAYAYLNEYFQVRKPIKNLETANTFLAETEKKSGVQKTESGLLYEIIQEGTIKATNDADTVVVIYTGTLPDGTVFDSTEKHGTENDSFPLNGVIPAWTEGMKLVGIGGKVKLYAHPDLAYGARGAGQLIGPNQALVFDVEIVDVKPATTLPVEEEPAVVE